MPNLPAVSVEDGISKSDVPNVVPVSLRTENRQRRIENWSFLVILLVLSGAIILTHAALHQASKTVEPQDNSSYPGFSVQDHGSMDATVPKTEKQNQPALTGKMSPHEESNGHQIANHTEDAVTSVEPRL